MQAVAVSHLTSKRPRLLLADDHCLLRQALRHLLVEQLQIDVVDDVPVNDQLVSHIEQTAPDVVLLHLGNDTHRRLHLIDALRRDLPDTRLLVVATRPCRQCVGRLTRFGVHGILTVWTDSAELRHAILHVLDDQRYIGADVMVDEAGDSSGLSPEHAHLSPRQRQIFDYIARGLSIREIAAALNISAKTVETHRARVQQLLGLNSAKALLNYAMQQLHHSDHPTSDEKKQVRINPTERRTLQR